MNKELQPIYDLLEESGYQCQQDGDLVKKYKRRAEELTLTVPPFSPGIIMTYGKRSAHGLTQIFSATMRQDMDPMNMALLLIAVGVFDISTLRDIQQKVNVKEPA